MKSIELFEKEIKPNKKQKQKQKPKKEPKSVPKDAVYPRDTTIQFDQAQPTTENISVIGVYNGSQKSAKTSKKDAQFELRENNEISKSQQSKKKKSFFSKASSKSKKKDEELGKVSITIDNSAPLPPPPPASLFNDYTQSASNSVSFQPPPPPPPPPPGSMPFNKRSGSRKSANETPTFYAIKSKQEQTGNEPMASDFDYNDFIKQIDEQDEENESKSNNNVLY